jgi:hypothetical protein
VRRVSSLPPALCATGCVEPFEFPLPNSPVPTVRIEPLPLRLSSSIVSITISHCSLARGTTPVDSSVSDSPPGPALRACCFRRRTMSAFLPEALTPWMRQRLSSCSRLSACSAGELCSTCVVELELAMEGGGRKEQEAMRRAGPITNHEQRPRVASHVAASRPLWPFVASSTSGTSATTYEGRGAHAVEDKGEKRRVEV